MKRNAWQSIAWPMWPLLLPLLPSFRSPSGALVVGVCWLAVMLLPNRRAATADMLDAGLLALSAWVVLGISWSAHGSTTLSAAWQIGPGALAFFATRQVRPERTERILSALALGGGLLAFGALLELAGRNLHLLPPPAHWQALGRAHWPLTNPDHLAYLMEGVVPFAFLLFLRRPSAGRLAILLVLLSTLAATLSASAPLALLGAVVLAFVRGQDDRSRPRVRAIIATTLLAIAAMMPYWWLGARGALTAGDPAGERLLIWKAGWQAWLDRPCTGFGFGCFDRAMAPHQNWLERVDYTHAHNILLEWLTTTGIVGALLGCLCLAAWWRRRTRDTWPARAAVAGCVVMLLHEGFDFGLLETAGSCWFGFLTGLAVARKPIPPATTLSSELSKRRVWASRWPANLAAAALVMLAALAGLVCRITSPNPANDDSIAQDPRNPAPILQAATLARLAGKAGEAERLARLALARQPGLTQTRLLLAAALQRQGRNEAAREWIRPLIPFYDSLPVAEKQEAADEIDCLASLVHTSGN